MKLEIYGDTNTAFHGHGEYQGGVDKPLRPCPFCGGSNIIVENTHTPCYEAECEECGATGPRGRSSSYSGNHIRQRGRCERLHREAFDAAIAGWNGRTNQGDSHRD